MEGSSAGRQGIAADSLATAESLTASTKGGRRMTTKDKNTKKSMEKKPAQKTLKEKRQAKKAKK
jgi:hypothetical protein